MFDHVPAEFPKHDPLPIAFVGEAPGDYEMARGRPFVGPSGEVLNQLLRTANIDRERVLVTNVFDIQLPDNDVDNWAGSTKEAKDWLGVMPGESELPPVIRGRHLYPAHWHHLERMQRELDLYNPNIIVALGGTALWALTGALGIKARRGAVDHGGGFAGGRKVIPTYHPAAVARDYKLFPVVVSDLEKAVREMEYPETRYSEIDLLIEPTLDEIVAFRHDYLDLAEGISEDIETLPAYSQITAVGFAPLPARGIAMCIPFVDFRNPDRSYWRTLPEELEAWRHVREINDQPALKLGQNFPYDWKWLWERAASAPRNYGADTRLKSHSRYPELKKDLGTLGSRWANANPWKTMRPKMRKRDE